MPTPVKRGQTVELTIEKFADKGQSLARVDGYVVFVRGAVPGDRVRAYVSRAKRSYAKAVVDELLEPSALRTEPRCRYAETCGGCKWQHVEIEAQREAKRQSVEEAFRHQSDFAAVEVPPAIPSPQTFFYRNKMDFDFSADRWLTRAEIDSGQDFDLDFALGLHVPGNFYKVLDLHECHLQSALSARLVNGVRGFVRAQGWAPWDIRKHHGFLRHLMIRTGEHTGEVMVALVTNGHDAERMATFADWLRAGFPEVTTFVNVDHQGRAQNVEGEAHVVFGPGVIHDTIGGYRFAISPPSFFQTNTRGAERLYEVARDFAALRPTDRVYDLYCGAGTISIFLAAHVEAVVGVELVPEAVADARRNAEANGVTNCTFVTGDMKALFGPDFVEAHGRPDVLIVDPPRAGLHKDVVAQIAALGPARFVYVSCNPQTQVRDLDLLRDTYRLDAVQPVDMFPHTPHIENVAKLTRRDALTAAA